MSKKISVRNVYPALSKRTEKAAYKFSPSKARGINHTSGIVAIIAAMFGTIAQTI